MMEWDRLLSFDRREKEPSIRDLSQPSISAPVRLGSISIPCPAAFNSIIELASVSDRKEWEYGRIGEATFSSSIASGRRR